MEPKQNSFPKYKTFFITYGCYNYLLIWNPFDLISLYLQFTLLLNAHKVLNKRYLNFILIAVDMILFQFLHKQTLVVQSLLLFLILWLKCSSNFHVILNRQIQLQCHHLSSPKCCCIWLYLLLNSYRHLMKRSFCLLTSFERW